MATETPAQKLRPKKHALGVGGLSLFGTGGCLMWTVILIPVAIPLAVVGLVMMMAAPFVKTEPLTCPKCGQATTVEKQVNVAACPHCATVIKREASGWAVS